MFESLATGSNSLSARTMSLGTWESDMHLIMHQEKSHIQRIEKEVIDRVS